MTDARLAQRGRELVRSRVAEAAALVAEALGSGAPACAWRGALPRAVATTGIGSSEAHARHLARLVETHARLPARYVDTGRLAGGPPADAREDALVVFSQGLSPNARFALGDAAAWGHVLLVTGLPRPGAPGFAALSDERQRWLHHLEGVGGEQIVLPCGAESGTLTRFQGPRLGYLVAWSIVRALARQTGLEPDVLPLDAPALVAALEGASGRAVASLSGVASPQAFFAPDRPLVLVASEGYGELASHLALKIAEGTLRTAPPLVDALSFAHGPLQGVFGRPASVAYLGRSASEADAAWRARVAAAVDAERNDLLVLDAQLASPFCVLEHEAMLDALLLAWLETSDIDPSRWPGREHEAVLYDVAPDPPA